MTGPWPRRSRERNTGASGSAPRRVRDLQPNGDAGQITVYGKGGKTRVVLLKATIWKDLALLICHLIH
jgi:hypothetical protein